MTSLRWWLVFSLTFLSLYQLAAVDLYWVNGSGDWNSAANWSLTSGGAGGAGIPTSSDNVFFDASSFTGGGQTVNVAGGAFCRDMIWSGVTNNPSFSGNSSIVISGSMQLDPNMINNLNGNIEFTSTNLGETITTAGHLFLADVIFNGNGGEWTISDEINIETTLDLVRGSLIARNVSVTCNQFRSRYTTDRSVDFTGSTVTILQRSPFLTATFDLGGSGMIFSGDMADFIFSGTQFAGSDGLIDISGDFLVEFGDVSIMVENMVLRNESDLITTFNDITFFGNAEVFGDYIFETVTFNNGFTYLFENGSRQVITDLFTLDPCIGLANLLAMLGSDELAIFEFTSTAFVGDIYVRGIRAERAPGVLAGKLTFNTLDGGNTPGWVLDNTPGGRTLYWVGGSGDWHDPANWSLSSGGMGGQCPPVNSDNVVFDDNSFMSSSDVVSGTAPAHVNTIEYTATNFRATIQLSDLFVNDNLLLPGTVNWQILEIWLIGNDEAGFMDQQEILAGDNVLINLTSLSKRAVTLKSDLNMTGTLVISATPTNGQQPVFETENFDIVAERLIAQNANLRIDLFDSNITITGEIEGGEMPLIIEGIVIGNRGNPTFFMTGNMSGFLADSGPLGRIIFTDETGLGTAVSSGFVELQLLEFRGDGDILQQIFNLDSLVFNEGHTYRSQEGQELIVNSYFEAFGGICLPITWTSTSSGDPAFFNTPSGTPLNMQYVQMMDQRGNGSNPYFAGFGSIDLGGNAGWDFPSENDPNPANQFLGDMIRLCSDENPVTLTPFASSEINSIVWNDGSTDLSFEVPMTTGQVYATVILTNSCEISDTVDVVVDQVFSVELGNDTTLCAGEELIISPGITRATYLWQDGSDDSTFVVTSPDDIEVLVTRGACADNDELAIDFTEISFTDLGEDQTICEGTSINLNATSSDPQVSYLWQDGQTSPIITATEPGVYLVQLSKLGCVVTDDVQVIVAPAPIFSLPEDTTLCGGETLELSSYDGPGSVMWNDGFTDPTRTIDMPGMYIANSSLGACTFGDTILIDFIVLNEVNLGGDTSLCEGESLTLDASGNASASYTWSDGSDMSNLLVESSGLYSVEVTSGRCSVSDQIDVNFDPLPNLNLGSDTILCEGESLLLISGLDSGTFLWSDGSTAPNLTVTTPGTYSLNVDRGACSVSDEIEVTEVGFNNFTLGNDTTICGDLEFALEAPLTDDGTWVWSDGSLGSTLEIQSSGTYGITIQIASCQTTDEIDVEVVESIELNLGNDTTLCAGESLTLDGSQPGLTYTWSTGENTGNIIVTSPGMYDLTASRQDVCFDSDTIQVDFLTIEPFDLGNDTTICGDVGFALEAPPTDDGTWIWSDGSLGSTLDIQSSGTYGITIQIANCQATDDITIDVVEPVDLNVGNDTTLCAGESLTLDGSQPGLSYLWNTGEISGDIIVTNSGMYELTASRQDVCFDSDTIQVDFLTIEQFDLGNDTTLCEGESLLLDPGIGGMLSYVWQDNSMESTFLAAQTGLYSVEVNLENCGAADSIQVTFTAAEPVDLGLDTAFCQGESLLLDATVSSATYSWQDGTTDATLTVSQSGIYTVRVDQGECVVVDSINILVNPIPLVNLGGDVSACEGEVVILDATQMNATYLWQDNSSGSQLNVTMDGQYGVTVEIDGCIGSDMVEVAFNPLPVFDLGLDRSLCESETATIGVPDMGLSYLWNNNATTSQIDVGESGTYVLTVTSDANCSDSDSITMEFRPLPSFDLGPDRSFCEGETTSLTIPDSFDVYQWNTGEITNAITVSAEGFYLVTTELGGCTTSDSINISSQSRPQFELGMDTAICNGSSLILDVEVAGATYSWSTGESNSTLTINQPGTYSVVVDINGCAETDEIEISGLPSPDFSLGDDRVICENEETTLSLGPNNWNVVWSTGDLTDDITVDAAGTYTVTAELDGCTTSDEVVVSVQPLPRFDLGGSIAKCEDLAVQLSVDRSDVEVIWQDGSMGNIFIAEIPGIYSAQAMTDLGCVFTDEVEVTNRECMSFTMYVPEAFSPNNDGRNDFFTIGIPSEIQLFSYSIEIFDRWGNNLFGSQNLANSWDGRYKNSEMKPGVYTYVINVTFSDDFDQQKSEVFSGSFTLLK